MTTILGRWRPPRFGGPMANKKQLTARENARAPGQEGQAREIALQVLKDLEEKQTYANLALSRVLNRVLLPGNERSLLTELVYGTIQRRNTLDWVLQQFLKHPLDKLTPWIRTILRLGVYQILYLDRIPDAAAVDESVKLAQRYGHRGVAGLTNAVLRKVSAGKESLPWPSRDTQPESYLSLYYSYPLWMVQRWLHRLGWDETEALCISGNKAPPLTVRTNTLRSSRKDLMHRLHQEDVASQECRYAPEGLHLQLAGNLSGLKSFQEGLFQVQGESSMLVSHLLNPQPGERVLDVCSAPGGKTVHMGLLMQNRGKIRASDLYPQRLKLVQEAAARQGVSIVRTEPLDGRQMPAHYHERFDRVLLDVPCSGLGVIRRKSDLKWKREPEDIVALQLLQKELLAAAYRALKPKGVLVYSACTLEPEETDQVVQAFLENEPSSEPALLAPLLPAGLVEAEKEAGIVRLWPHKDDLDGFFIAKIRKNGVGS